VTKRLLLLPLLILGLAACRHFDEVAAVATLEPRSGSNVSGRVEFTEIGNDRVRVFVRLSGLPPNSTHGFHVHEFGDCSSPTSESAGGHFNPTGDPHGGRHEEPRHSGDFGNVTTNDRGEVSTSFGVDNLTVRPGPLSVMGRAVVVHRQRDDLTSQPTGDSGDRIACGVVGPIR
jgi:superoxide dismutase, Cu-Zn family